MKSDMTVEISADGKTTGPMTAKEMRTSGKAEAVIKPVLEKSLKLIPRSVAELEKLKRDLADLTREYMDIEAEKAAANEEYNDRLKVTWKSMQALKLAIEDQ